MKASEAHQKADEAKKQMLAEVESYADSIMTPIELIIEEEVKRGMFHRYFKSLPNVYNIPVVVKHKVLSIVFDRLENEGYRVEWSNKEERGPNDYSGAFTLSW